MDKQTLLLNNGTCEELIPITCVKINVEHIYKDDQPVKRLKIYNP